MPHSHVAFIALKAELFIYFIISVIEKYIDYTSINTFTEIS